MMTRYEQINEYDLPVQSVLAFRLIYNHASESCHLSSHQTPKDLSRIHPFELVGHYADNDSTRVDLATALFEAVRHCAKYIMECDVEKCFDILTIRTALQIIRQNAFRFRFGVALFPLCALLNHSCAPNAVMTMDQIVFNGQEDSASSPSADLDNGCRKPVSYSATIRSLRDISEGEEICICYKPLGLLPSSLRQEIMLSSHDFRCQCEACRVCSDCDELLLGEEKQETAFELSLEPLVELLDSAEENISDCANLQSSEVVHDAETAEDRSEAEDLLQCAFQFLEQAERGFGNMGLREFHFLRFRRLALLTEASLLEKDMPSVVLYCSQWIEGVTSQAGGSSSDTMSPLARLCDVHLMCRMRVILAEALMDLLQTPDIIYTTKKFRNKVVCSLDEAISLASAIYGDDYAMVTVLQRKKKESVLQAEQLGDGPMDLAND